MPALVILRRLFRKKRPRYPACLMFLDFAQAFPSGFHRFHLFVMFGEERPLLLVYKSLLMHSLMSDPRFLGSSSLSATAASTSQKNLLY